MARHRVSTLREPITTRTIVDFRDGTHTLTVAGGGGDVQYDSAFPANFATGRVFSLSSRGFEIGASAFADTSKYVAGKYEPGGATIDFSNASAVGIEIEAEEGDGAYGGQSLNGFSVYLVDETGATTYTHYCQKSFGVGGAKSAEVMMLWLPLWNWTTGGGGPAGFPHEMTSVKKIEFRLTPHASGLYASRMWIRRVVVGRPCEVPVLLWSMDDGWDSQYNIVWPYIRDNGLKMTLFPQTSIFDTANKLTTAQAQEMHAGGVAFANHGLDHSRDPLTSRVSAGNLTRVGTVATCVTALAHLRNSGDYVTARGWEDPKWNRQWGPITVTSPTSYTFDCVGDELSGPVSIGTFDRDDNINRIPIIVDGSVETFTKKGLTGALDCWAYMNGYYNRPAIEGLVAKGQRIARTTNVGPNSNEGCFDPRVNDYRSLMALPTRSVDQQTATQMFAWLDQLEEMGGALSMYGHESVDSRTPGSSQHDYLELQKFLVTGSGANASVKQRIAEGRLMAMTYPEYLNRLHRPYRYAA